VQSLENFPPPPKKEKRKVLFLLVIDSGQRICPEVKGNQGQGRVALGGGYLFWGGMGIIRECSSLEAGIVAIEKC
jgi:hypothetical protein